ncbi:MAG: tetratricopeptide repeat protein [Acidobacteriota bacterium]|nr:tetratricopeptide repeat protein [Acidobacteriota bacterium]
MIRLPICLSLYLISGIGALSPAFCQTTDPKPPAIDKSSSYYNFAMGHYYAELAGAYGNRSDYVNKAVDYYKLAIKQDPSATFLAEELTDLYIQAGQLSKAVTEAEEMLKQNPENLEARRILGRIYTRMIGDTQQGKVDDNMLRKSIEQYSKITQKDPKDLDSWLILGRLQRVSRNSLEAEKAFKQALAQDSENDEALTGLAMVYSDLGDNKNAVEMLRRASEKSPNPRTLAALASFYEQARDFKSAADAWKKALALSPEDTRLKRALAQDLLFSERLDEALALYGEIAREEPRDPQVQLRISEIYRQKRDFEKAREAYNKAKELDKDNIEVRYDEVNLLDAEGKPDQAITVLKTILDETAKKQYTDAEKSGRGTLLERLGTLYRSTNKYPQAIAAFRQISDLEPNAAPSVAIQVIETHRMAKDLAAARQESDAALKKFPKDRSVALEHASLLADTGKTDQAVTELRALMSGGKDREMLLSIAQIYDKAKRFTDEQSALDQAEKLSTGKQDREGVRFMRGAMFERMKNYEGAEAAFRSVLKDDPDNAGALNYLGYMLADRDVRLDEANKLISRAVELDPQNGAYLDSLGWVYYRQNRLDQAEDQLRRALEKMSKDPTVHDHLGDVYFKQGKVKEAIAQWQASLKEWDSTPPADLDPLEVAKVTKKLESARVRVAKESGANR